MVGIPSLWACDKEGDVCVKQKKEHKIKSIILFISPPNQLWEVQLRFEKHILP